jgi:hypothetical protein
LRSDVAALAEPQDEPEDDGQQDKSDGESAAMPKALRHIVEHDDRDHEEGDAPDVGDQGKEQEPCPGLGATCDSQQDDEVVDGDER